MTKGERIYLDHAATTPLLPEVAEAMAPWLGPEYGNPSSLHAEGRAARSAIDESRETLSKALDCLFAEVIFTASGTEAANLAILGAALGNVNPARRRILFSASEHHCVLHLQPVLERLGYSVELVPVDREARIRVDALSQTLAEDVLLVSAMHANNELGTLQPVSAAAELCSRHGALFHCDAVQTFTVWPWKAADLGADLISLSAHKIKGPKGAGTLFIKAGTRLKPTIYGGGQEREMRAGTENVAAIVGFSAAVRAYLRTSRPELGVTGATGSAAIASANRPKASGTGQSNENGHCEERQATRQPTRQATSGEGEASSTPGLGAAVGRQQARDAYVERLNAHAIPGLEWSVPDWADVVPGHAHCRIAGISAESMLILLDRMGVSASSGAACSSGSLEPSHVLLACGYSQQQANEGLRFTFGIGNDAAQAVRAADLVAEAAVSIRGGVPFTNG